MQNAGPPTKSILRYLIEVGGADCFPIVLFSMVLIVWGLVNLAVVKNRWALLLQALLSFGPSFLACLGLIGSFVRFRNLATSPGPVQPEELGQVMSIGIVLGIVGSASTAIPAIIGILALARNVRPPAPDRKILGEI